MEKHASRTHFLIFRYYSLGESMPDKCVTHGFQIELEFRNVGFWGINHRNLKKNPLGQDWTNNRLNPLIASDGVMVKGSECCHCCAVPAVRAVYDTCSALPYYHFPNNVSIGSILRFLVLATTTVKSQVISHCLIQLHKSFFVSNRKLFWQGSIIIN